MDQVQTIPASSISTYYFDAHAGFEHFVVLKPSLASRQLLIWLRHNPSGRPLARPLLNALIARVRLQVNGYVALDLEPDPLLWLYRHCHGWIKRNPMDRGLLPISFGDCPPVIRQPPDFWQLSLRFSSDPRANAAFRMDTVFLADNLPLLRIVKPLRRR